MPALKPNLYLLGDPFAISTALEAWEKRDGALFAMAGYSCHAELNLVIWNIEGLKKRGMYEAALVAAFTGCKYDNAYVSLGMLQALFRGAEHKKLLALGSPLPGNGPFVVYRGVRGTDRELPAGIRVEKRPRGLSWTTSLDVACWLAMRHNFDKPAVYRAVLNREDVFLYVTERGEQEFIGCPRSCKCVPLSLEELRAGSDRYQETIRLADQKRMKELKKECKHN